ncbi:MAG: hypothetical protein GY869_16960 [Planctomycetes bacterium]|nr:hypothetical protein [Planctomycetota bacterium]
MQNRLILMAMMAAALCVSVPAATAHIDILSHETRHGRFEIKNGPCGVLNSERGTNIYTYAPGETITIVVDEYIPHPGYFRIAFDDIGDDDFLNPQSVDPINRECMDDPSDHCGEPDFYNSDTVLMDNLAPHIPEGLQSKDYTFEVDLPDIECDNCTLQIIQVMTDPFPIHAPYDPSPTSDDIYYQCIDLVLKQGAGDAPDPPKENQCPVDFLAHIKPGTGINAAALRNFRDRGLDTCFAGNIITRLYYMHAEEITGLLASDPALTEAFGRVVQNPCGRIKILLANGHTAFTRAEIDEAKEQLKVLSKKGSPELMAAIDFVLTRMEEKTFLQQFGVYIIEK